MDFAHDVSEGASKANSGIVHAGYDAKAGTEKARLNVKGARMMKDLCRTLGVPYGQPGALVLGFHEEDRKALEALYENAKVNGVPGCRLIERDEILKMEPNISPEVLLALDVPASGLVSPYELTHALADSAKENGFDFLLGTKAEALSFADGVWTIKTQDGDVRRGRSSTARVCMPMCCTTRFPPSRSRSSRARQYYLLTTARRFCLTAPSSRCPPRWVRAFGIAHHPRQPAAGPHGGGHPRWPGHRHYRDGLTDVLAKARLTFPNADLRQVITTFSGIRAHEVEGDFLIGQVEGAPEGAFEAIGIESPGLSAAPAIGEELGDWVAYYLKLKKNLNYIAPTPLPKAFAGMNEQERRAAYEIDPDYGRIVCRCEQVTEAEVRRSIRRPMGARSLDGVKRRTRAGMGRCQSGFCSTRVMEILAEELGQDLRQISKSGGKSWLLTGGIGKEDSHD